MAAAANQQNAADGLGQLRLHDFEFCERLGSGASGAVFRVVHKASGGVFVIKCIKLALDSGTSDRRGAKSRMTRESVLREVSALAALKSDYVIRHYATFFDSDAFYILIEHAARGSLAEEIARRRAADLRFRWPQRTCLRAWMS